MITAVYFDSNLGNKVLVAVFMWERDAVSFIATQSPYMELKVLRLHAGKAVIGWYEIVEEVNLIDPTEEK